MNTFSEHISIASRLENVNQAEELVEKLVEKGLISDSQYGNVIVAVTEGVLNAIQHGNKMDASKPVEITISGGEKKLEITIEDQGDGFDYNNLPDPTDPSNIEKPNGRGIFLIRNLSDVVEFDKDGRKMTMAFLHPVEANVPIKEQ